MRTLMTFALTLIATMMMTACEKAAPPAEPSATTPSAPASPVTGGEVVLYCSADDHIARPVIERFERETGIQVIFRGDTEATKNTGLAERLRAEKDRPVADVFWSSEAFMTIKLAEEGLLAPHRSAAVAEWPAHLRDPDQLWHGFASRARVVVFNTQRVQPEDVPPTMHHLIDPRLGGRVVIARPQFGTTRGHMGALVALWGEREAWAWITDLKSNGTRQLDGNATVVRAVATGQADMGLTDTDDVWAGQRNGWPVDMVYIRHDLPSGSVTAGPMLIPNTVSLIAGGPNPRNGAALADYLLSEEVEKLLAESESRNVPIRESLAAKYPALAVPDPMTVPYKDIAAGMEPAMRMFEQDMER